MVECSLPSTLSEYRLHPVLSSLLLILPAIPEIIAFRSSSSLLLLLLIILPHDTNCEHVYGLITTCQYHVALDIYIISAHHASHCEHSFSYTCMCCSARLPGFITSICRSLLLQFLSALCEPPTRLTLSRNTTNLFY